jgi:hypothetical protein
MLDFHVDLLKMIVINLQDASEDKKSESESDECGGLG